MTIIQSITTHAEKVIPYLSGQLHEASAQLTALTAQVKIAATIPLHLGHALAGGVIRTITLGNYYKGVGPEQWALAKEAIAKTDFVSLVIGSTLAYYSAQTYRSFWRQGTTFSFPVAIFFNMSDALKIFVPYVSSQVTELRIATSNDNFGSKAGNMWNNEVTPEVYRKNRSEVASAHRWYAFGNLVQIAAFYQLKQKYASCTIPFYLLCVEQVRNAQAMFHNYRTTHIEETRTLGYTFHKYCDRNGKYQDCANPKVDQ